jgi:DNA-binding beta-propeller fold protein YncE
MNAILNWFSPRRILAVGRALSLMLICSSAQAQSSPVFMTADDETFTSHVHRFDNGSQTYAVNTGGFDAFQGVTTLNGEVLVADFVADAIQRFSPSGTYLGTFGSPGGSPTFLESDSSGNVYTTLLAFPIPPGMGSAVRLNSAGAITGTFAADRGIDADAVGNVYAINTGMLVKYAPNGVFINSIAVGTSAWDLAIDESGSRLFLSDQGNTVSIYDISGAIPSLSASLVTPASADIVGVHFASESGNILVTDHGFGSLDPRGLEYSPSHVLLDEYRPTFGGEVVLQAWDITTFPIPEPSSMLLVVAGVVAAGISARRQGR